MSLTIPPGAPYTFTVQWLAYEGGPANDVTAQTVKIRRLSDLVYMVTATSDGIVHVATGLYAYQWEIPADAAGDFAIVWDATDGSSDAVQAYDLFTVAQPEAAGDAFATVTQYENRLGLAPTTGPKRTQIATRLGDASALMRTRMPAGFTPDPADALAVCVAITQRVIANPGGLRQVLVGSYSELRDTDSGLFITDAEVAQINGEGSPSDPSDGAYTLQLVDRGLHGHHHGRFGEPPWRAW